jgi:hypothetical protein
MVMLLIYNVQISSLSVLANRQKGAPAKKQNLKQLKSETEISSNTFCLLVKADKCGESKKTIFYREPPSLPSGALPS